MIREKSALHEHEGVQHNTLSYLCSVSAEQLKTSLYWSNLQVLKYTHVPSLTILQTCTQVLGWHGGWTWEQSFHMTTLCLLFLAV